MPVSSMLSLDFMLSIWRVLDLGAGVMFQRKEE